MDHVEAEARMRALLAAISGRDAEALAALLDPEVEWWFQRSIAELQGWERPLVGIPAVLRAEIPEQSAFRSGTTTYQIHHVLVDGDHFAAMVERVSQRQDGTPYLGEYNFTAHLRDGRVLEMWIAVDSLAATRGI